MVRGIRQRGHGLTFVRELRSSPSPSTSTTTIVPGRELAEEDLLAERVLDLTLHRAPKRPCAKYLVDLLGQQLLRCRSQLDRHVLIFQTLLKTANHEVDDVDDFVLAAVEHDGVIDAVQELRTEVLLELCWTFDFICSYALVESLADANPRLTPFDTSRLPRLVVMTMTVFLKSTDRPCASVSRPVFRAPATAS